MLGIVKLGTFSGGSKSEADFLPKKTRPRQGLERESLRGCGPWFCLLFCELYCTFLSLHPSHSSEHPKGYICPGYLSSDTLPLPYIIHIILTSPLALLGLMPPRRVRWMMRVPVVVMGIQAYSPSLCPGVGPKPPVKKVRKRGHLMTSTFPLTAIMQLGLLGHRR